MTFDGLFTDQFSATFKGIEIVGMYQFLLQHEEGLDQHQRASLDRLRAILYENLSVEDLEDIGMYYASALLEDADL